MKSGTDYQFLLDTNALIDYVGGKYTEAFYAQLENDIRKGTCATSVVAGTESLSGKVPSYESEQILGLLAVLPIIDFTEDLMPLAASIRRQYRLKLPDAMIAATAIANNLSLITNDLRGYHTIDALVLLRPAFRS